MRAKLLLVGMLAAAWPSTALPQQWPAKPIRIIVPFPAGGGVDYIGRVMAKHLSERLNQQVVVDNRAGSNGILGWRCSRTRRPTATRSRPHRTVRSSNNLILYSKLPYDTLRDFAPIGNLVMFPLMLVDASVAAGQDVARS